MVGPVDRIGMGLGFVVGIWLPSPYNNYRLRVQVRKTSVVVEFVYSSGSDLYHCLFLQPQLPDSQVSHCFALHCVLVLQVLPRLVGVPPRGVLGRYFLQVLHLVLPEFLRRLISVPLYRLTLGRHKRY